MTEPKEYIITPEVVCGGCDMCNEHGRLDCEMMVRVRQSRPHTPASVPAPKRTQSERNLCLEFIITRKELNDLFAGCYTYRKILDILTERGTVEHDAAIRKHERGRLLKAFGESIDSGMLSAGDCQYSDEPVVTVQFLVRKLESLRESGEE
jgi:hypothetical protein